MNLCIHVESLKNVEKILKAITLKLGHLKKKGLSTRCNAGKTSIDLQICLQCYCLLCSTDKGLHSHEVFLDPTSSVISCAVCARRYFLRSLTNRIEDTVIVSISSSLYEVFPYIPLKGFSNLGNTCYINAVLSIMINLCPIRDELLSNTHTRFKCRDSRCIMCAMKSLIDYSYGSECVLTHKFIHTMWLLVPHFVGSMQQDVHEFFVCLLQKIHEAYDFQSTDEITCKCLSHRTFFGMFSSTMLCRNCNLKKTKEEAFATIPLECLPSIQSSLDIFLGTEDLKDEVMCEACQEEGLCTKRLEVKRYPRVLSLHLKRFSYEGVSRKIDSHVALSNTLAVGERIYDVLGFISHRGSITYGHYLSYAIFGGKWYRMDDERVEVIPYEKVSTEGLYLAYYLLRGK
ncbi:ubiquitin carboxyl-terminal hydrolase [Encephalitozoon intestinalis ATCC 50506]|uniref:Ubiquitin carboxyl-terminal hydrolase n=1 Tax=Encephalitozoon intestinalis (strain ATCC 50506) TaxID=876142 RepID=E0S6Z1_ENCIT|nr:ubiquitin carboxyl-terminal hydrolase [Encephalitozoon intestinalis ATCC 50506]ADM11577.1 ubiquitin carboxyl-terminal hydrolase [Encephalitozoon intestinalis ATCC 50506]UTX45294.1 ubiquitin carboxyl-terminal hydrolase [Encephalitozoon intestinalis]